MYPCKYTRCVALADEPKTFCKAHRVDPTYLNEPARVEFNCTPEVQDYINALRADIDENDEEIAVLEDKIAAVEFALGR